MSENPRITTERRDHVFLMGLNRPEKKNAFNREMLQALSVAYTAYEEDESLWAAVLFGHGDSFTGGLDLRDLAPIIAQGERLFPDGMVDPLDMAEPRRSKPVVCVVHGWCLTIGVELMLASDIRVASTNTRIAQLEVTRGIMPFGGATMRLPFEIGWGNSMRYLLTGDEMSPAEAHRLGLVQEVVEQGKHIARGIELAVAITGQAALAVQATRRNSRRAIERGRLAALGALHEDCLSLMGTQDAREGLLSFVDKRQAKFRGR